jgi:hypothetical protein
MPCGHQHGYRYDFFVSYSSRDAAWVNTFLSDLVADTNRFAATDVFLFFDKLRLQPGFMWNETLLESAKDSALFLPILSPRFFQSDYCQKETNAFLAANNPSSITAPHRSRVLPVKLFCTAPTDHALAAFQATNFCSVDADNIPIEFATTSPQYHEAVRKLAVSIATLLQNIPPKAQRRPAVYLSVPQHQKIRDSLAHTFEVLPHDPQLLLALQQTELEQAFAADLTRASVSVHTLPDAPMAKPLIQAQLAAAAAHAKPRLIFSAEAPLPDLLNKGFEWLRSQTDLEDRIRRLVENPPERERKASSHEPLIYFLCSDRSNKTSAEPLLANLEAKGIRVYPSPLDGPADQAFQTHVQALDELDGCLIYYGNVSREWFDSVFLRIAKKIRQRGLPSAIFLAPPPTDHKTSDLGRLGVPLVSDADSTARAFLLAQGAGPA